jgi:hypothetical protein
MDFIGEFEEIIFILLGIILAIFLIGAVFLTYRDIKNKQEEMKLHIFSEQGLGYIHPQKKQSSQNHAPSLDRPTVGWPVFYSQPSDNDKEVEENKKSPVGRADLKSKAKLEK